MSKLIKGLLGGVLLAASHFSLAQESGTLTWIVPYGPGGGTDVVARMLAEPMGEGLGRHIVVDNRAGGGTIIGVSALARARPDGGTVGTVGTSQLTVLPYIQADLPFDAEKGFSYVGGIGIYPWVLMVNSKVPVNNLRELIELAKSKPEGLSYGIPNAKGNALLSMTRFQEAAGIELLAVPYRGEAPAIQDLLAGQIDMYLGNPIVMLPHVKSGMLRPLAVGRMDRLPFMPDVPTFDEEGLKGLETYEWQVLAAPAGTPPETISRLNAELNKVLKDEKLVKKLADMGVEPFPTTPDAIYELVKRDSEVHEPLIERLGLKDD